MVYRYCIIDSWSVLPPIFTNIILTTRGKRNKEKKKNKQSKKGKLKEEKNNL